MGSDTASESGGGQFDDRRYSREVIYGGSEEDDGFDRTGHGRRGTEESWSGRTAR